MRNLFIRERLKGRFDLASRVLVLSFLQASLPILTLVLRHNMVGESKALPCSHVAPVFLWERTANANGVAAPNPHPLPCTCTPFALLESGSDIRTAAGQPT
jgi:hypothetical protein